MPSPPGVRAGAAAAPPQRVAAHPHRERALERLDRRVARVRHRGVHAAHARLARAGRPARRRWSRSTPSPSPPSEHVVHRPLARRADAGRARRARARRGTRRRPAGSPRRCRRRPRPAGAAATTVPAGAITRTGRIAPPLAGIVGSVAERSANATALTVTASTALTLPGRCAPVPVKSNVAASPSIVSVDDDRRRATAARAAAGGVEHVRERVTARRAARRARRACVARRSRRPRRAARRRRAAASSARRATPSRFAPRCASRSPRRSSGVRELATKTASTSAASSDGRDAQALLVDLDRVGRHRARRHAAEVGVVGAVRGPADELAVRRTRARRA